MLISWYRVSNWLYRCHMAILSKLVWKISYLLFNSSIPPTVKIGEGTKIAYGGGRCCCACSFCNR